MFFSWCKPPTGTLLIDRFVDRSSALVFWFQCETHQLHHELAYWKSGPSVTSQFSLGLKVPSEQLSRRSSFAIPGPSWSVTVTLGDRRARLTPTMNDEAVDEYIVHRRTHSREYRVQYGFDLRPAC